MSARTNNTHVLRCVPWLLMVASCGVVSPEPDVGGAVAERLDRLLEDTVAHGRLAATVVVPAWVDAVLGQPPVP